MLKFILIALLLLSLGCATPMNVVMTNPETGKKVYISHHSYGLGLAGVSAAIAARQAQEKAIQAAKQMGYTQMELVK
jgi:hypothetical protein